jgi:hypothetical protein
MTIDPQTMTQAEGYDAAEKSLRSAMETVDALCDQLIPPSEGA